MPHRVLSLLGCVPQVLRSLSKQHSLTMETTPTQHLAGPQRQQPTPAAKQPMGSQQQVMGPRPTAKPQQQCPLEVHTPPCMAASPLQEHRHQQQVTPLCRVDIPATHTVARCRSSSSSMAATRCRCQARTGRRRPRHLRPTMQHPKGLHPTQLRSHTLVRPTQELVRPTQQLATTEAPGTWPLMGTGMTAWQHSHQHWVTWAGVLV
jgi:hypothetical protein